MSLASAGDLAPVIVSYARTPIGSFCGSLSKCSATFLGASAIKAAVDRAGVLSDEIDEVIMGNVLSAGVGQAPATQATIHAGLGHKIPSTTVNKVCASGMKAVMMGAQSLALGQSEVAVCGGMESMSNVPHYLMSSRTGMRLGNASLIDGCVYDGLWDPYNDQHMGMCAEKIAKDHKLQRMDQDVYAELSYTRAIDSIEWHTLHEIAPLEIPQKEGQDPVLVVADEEPTRAPQDLYSHKPAFTKEGTVTKGNSSKLNDGAAALVLMTKRAAKERGITPLCEILSFADTQRDPVDFTIAPSDAIPLACKRAGITIDQVNQFEINEAFAAVALANARLLDIDFLQDMNIHGGAIALGHPIGMSGARIVGTLAKSIEQKDSQIGVASICNGGGGASAIVLRRLK